MNANDCEQIGFILADYQVPEVICERFYKLDVRIRAEYEAWLAAKGRSSDVDELFKKLLEERYGHNWAISRSVTKEITRSVLEEARREVYGEEYHPSLFNTHA